MPGYQLSGLVLIGWQAGVDLEAAFPDLAADDHVLDLRGAFPDAVDADVPIEPLDRVLAHVAAPAQDLYRGIDDPAGISEQNSLRALAAVWMRLRSERP